MVPNQISLGACYQAALLCAATCIMQVVPAKAGEPAAPQQKLPASELITRGRALIDSNNAAAALPYFQRYVQLKPSSPEGHFWEGLALDQMGIPQKSIWSYGRALEAAARDGMDSAELRINIGNTLLKLARLDDAIFNYRRSIEIDSQQGRAHFNLGRALLIKGQAQAAFDSLNKSTELGLTDPSLPFFKGLALKSLGRHNDARAQLELYLKSLPTNAANQTRRQQVRSLMP